MTKKSAYYFSHDCNARSDEKILAVRMRHKSEGYAVFFMIIEMLAEEPSHSLLKDYNRIAFELRVSADTIKSIVEDFGLFHFTEDGERFYSESLIDRMSGVDDLKKKRSEAARKRWSKCKSNANASDEPCKSNILYTENDANKSKVNKNEKNSKEQKKASDENQPEISKPDYVLVETTKLHAELRAELSSQTLNAENAQRLLKLPQETIVSLLDDFQAKLTIEGKSHATRSDYRQHFNNWAAIQSDKLRRENKSQNATNGTDRLHVRPTTSDFYTDF